MSSKKKISQIFSEKSAAHNQKNRENMFAGLFSETPETPVPKLFLRLL